jgi:excisionase family DNA binding protein
MSAATVRDVESLPLVLTLRHVQDVLGISRPKVYELAHTRGFPVVRFGRTIRIQREAFLRWLEQQAGVEEG